MSEWRSVSLDHAAEVVMGQSPDGSAYNSAGRGTPLINGPAEFGSKCPTAIQWTSSPTKTCLPGDILFCVRGSTTGRVNIANDSYCIGRGLAAIRGRREVADTRFLQLLVGGLETRIFEEARGNGSTFPSISGDRLRATRFLLPGLAEQRRIAEILSTVDETIEQTEAMIAKYQQIKAGLMHDLFARGVMPDGRLRPRREDAPKFYKRSPIGWIPSPWEICCLADRRRPTRSHLKTGPFGSSLKGEHWIADGHPVITIGSLGDGILIDSELLYVSDNTAKRLCEYTLEAGDVVFSRVADVGRSIMITPTQHGWIMSSNLMRISLDPGSVRPAYLQAQLAADARVRQQIRRTVNSGGRDVANSQVLNGLLFAWPPVEEQDELLRRLGAIDEIIETERAALAKHSQCKTALMNEMLSGRCAAVRSEGSTL